MIKEAMLQMQSGLKKQTDKIQLQLIMNAFKKKKKPFSIWPLSSKSGVDEDRQDV